MKPNLLSVIDSDFFNLIASKISSSLIKFRVLFSISSISIGQHWANDVRRFLKSVTFLSCNLVLFAVGGWCSGDAIQTVERYDPIREEWCLGKFRLQFKIPYSIFKSSQWINGDAVLVSPF